MMMGRIRGKNTGPELAVRRYLFRAGLRFRIHPPNVLGKPDLVLPRYRSVVLVHGCFWHRHPGCKFAYTPKSNAAFWKRKFAANVARDRLVVNKLKAAGWRVFTIWECSIHGAALATLTKRIKDGLPTLRGS